MVFDAVYEVGGFAAPLGAVERVHVLGQVLELFERFEHPGDSEGHRRAVVAERGVRAAVRSCEPLGFAAVQAVAVAVAVRWPAVVRSADRRVQVERAHIKATLAGLQNVALLRFQPRLRRVQRAAFVADTRASFATFTGWAAGLTAELITGLTQLGNYVNRVRELRSLNQGGSTSDASYDALNEQLGNVAQRRRMMEEWEPFLDSQKKTKASELARLRAVISPCSARLPRESRGIVRSKMLRRNGGWMSWPAKLRTSPLATSTGPPMKKRPAMRNVRPRKWRDTGARLKKLPAP